VATPIGGPAGRREAARVHTGRIAQLILRSRRHGGGVSFIGSLLSLVLLLFLIALVVRAVLDWTSVLASGGRGVSRAREISHRVTEPVIGPVRRALPPVRIGDVQIDLAFTVVFFATVILRSVVSYL
jgi:YggT family protein